MDSPTPPTDSNADSICPWCSAALTADAAVCPSCGAILKSDEEQDLPGLTAVDARAALASARPPTRSRLLSWISGEYPDGAPTEAEVKADAHALEPPDRAVQREILRLELEAEVAKLQAEADANRADAMLEGRLGDATAEQDETPATEDDALENEDDAPADEDETSAAAQAPTGEPPA
jgi:hypothetical protein